MSLADVRSMGSVSVWRHLSSWSASRCYRRPIWRLIVGSALLMTLFLPLWRASSSFLEPRCLGGANGARNRALRIARGAFPVAGGTPDAGWSVDEERAIMDEVLGYSPAADTSYDHELAELLAENRLLRDQMSLLAQEVRTLTATLGSSSLPKAEGVTPPVPMRQAPAPVPAPAVAPAPVSAPAVAQAPVPAPVAATATPGSSGASGAGTRTVAKVVSAGHDSGNIADFFLDDWKVPISGQSLRRGLNVVIIDSNLRRMQASKTYDVWGNPKEENMRFAKDIEALAQDTIVLVALKDSGMENLDSSALRALRTLGADIERPLSARESYILVGCKDGEALIERQGSRMLLAEVALPYGVQLQASSPSTWATPTRSDPLPPPEAPAAPRSVAPQQAPAPRPAPMPPPAAAPSTAAGQGGRQAQEFNFRTAERSAAEASPRNDVMDMLGKLQQRIADRGGKPMQ